MQYVKITFAINSLAGSDVLIALLSEAGYDGFEETEDELFAYIGEQRFDEEELISIADASASAYRKDVIPAQNWNALWESNFEPVVIDDFCTIRAHFHDMRVTTPYEIVITPKMSFGTGHHATTRLMMMQMKDIDLKGMSVLDFGTGTGVLAILAEMLGASNILAIDNDDWCIENAGENIERNQCKSITIKKGSLEDIPFSQTNVMLANINRHILLEHMPALFQRLCDGGMILMSGLLTDDKEVMLKSAADAGFHFRKITEQSGWISLLFEKI
jgi:ribosomal protein L11 methyltransferase